MEVERDADDRSAPEANNKTDTDTLLLVHTAAINICIETEQNMERHILYRITERRIVSKKSPTNHDFG